MIPVEHENENPQAVAACIIQEFGARALSIVAERVDWAVLRGDKEECDRWLSVAVVIREAQRT